jgi:hypothetical protein
MELVQNEVHWMVLQLQYQFHFINLHTRVLESIIMRICY